MDDFEDDFEDEMKTTPEDRQYMATRLAEDFEKEQGSPIDSLIAEGTLDRTAVIELLAEAMVRMERYIISS